MTPDRAYPGTLLRVFALLLAMLLLAMLAALPVAAGTAGLTRVDTRSGGLARTYYYHLPPQASGDKPPPLVLAFHGGGGKAPNFARRTGLIEMADKYGYILVLPQGTSRFGKGGSWNADSITPQGYPENADIDDVGFVSQILGEMKKRARYDTNRVYATGMSMGGMLAYHLACELPPGTIAAIAVVAATYSSASCADRGKGISLLHIQGTDDQNVPWNGGRGKLSGRNADWPPIERGVDLFSTANACSVTQPGRKVARDTSCRISACSDGETVELCTVIGGGHAWPGAKPAKWQIRYRVHVSPYFDATDYIGEFFATH